MAGEAPRDAILKARARVSDMAERHRREQCVLFEELLTNLVEDLAAEPAAVLAEAPVAEPAILQLREDEPTARLRSERVTSQITEATVAIDSTPSIRPGGFQPEVASILSDGSDMPQKLEMAFHSKPCHNTNSRVAQWLERKLTRRERRADVCAAWVGMPLLRLVSWLDSLQEPERDGRLAHVVDSKMFTLLCFVIIALNAAFIVVTTDIDIGGDADSFDLGPVIECVFVAWYALELTLKLCVHRLFFFVGREAAWNWLDAALVLVSLSDVVATGTARSGVNVGFMRSLRFFKLAKVLRVFRTVRFFSELRLMFDCVLGSLISLVWCLIMIMFIVYVFALLIVQGLSMEIWEADTPFSEEQLHLLLEEFGSVRLAMMSLFKATTGGRDWGELYDLLSVSRGFVPLAFLAYIVFFVLAAWNIVTSMFVEKALKLAQPDLDTRALEQNSQDVEDARELTAIFAEIDADRSGTISLKELESVLMHPRFRSYLRVRGIDIHDANLFYRMMTSVVGDESQDIDLHFVVAACLRMKGAASSMDLHALTFESKLLNKKHRQHIMSVQASLGRIEDNLRGILLDCGALRI